MNKFDAVDEPDKCTMFGRKMRIHCVPWLLCSIAHTHRHYPQFSSVIFIAIRHTYSPANIRAPAAWAKKIDNKGALTRSCNSSSGGLGGNGRTLPLELLPFSVIVHISKFTQCGPVVMWLWDCRKERERERELDDDRHRQTERVGVRVQAHLWATVEHVHMSYLYMALYRK